MKTITNKILDRENDKPILLDVVYKPDNQPKPILVFCHGYKGFKDWGSWNLMSEYLANNGICVVKFNFSFNGGTIHDPIDFPDLEAFGNNNYSQELKDLEDVISWIKTEFKNNSEFNTENISLLGHSRGGGIVTIYASENPTLNAVISLAGVSDYKKRFPKDEALDKWKKEGVYYVLNGRTKQEMPHYYQFFEDFINNEKRLTIKTAAEKLSVPHLIIHGDNDTSVSINEAYNLHKWNPKSNLKIIKDANHVLGSSHPWNEKELPLLLKEASNNIIEFILNL